MFQYNLNKCVFNRRLKSSLLAYGSRKLPGNEFQTEGPATEKTRGPNMLGWHHRTTTNHQVADQRCCLDETSETGSQRSVMYCDAWSCRQT